jgi:hypothetical protein
VLELAETNFHDNRFNLLIDGMHNMLVKDNDGVVSIKISKKQDAAAPRGYFPHIIMICAFYFFCLSFKRNGFIFVANS